MGRFGGKVALVTGSTQGLGEAIAARLVDEGLSGLVVTGRDEERGAAVAARLNDAACRTVFTAADLADPGVGRQPDRRNRPGVRADRRSGQRCRRYAPRHGRRHHRRAVRSAHGGQRPSPFPAHAGRHPPNAPRGHRRFDREHRLGGGPRRSSLPDHLLHHQGRPGDPHQERGQLGALGSNPGQRS